MREINDILNENELNLLIDNKIGKSKEIEKEYE